MERIKKSWIEQKEIKNIMLFLQSHNVSTTHATKIWKTYGNESIKVVQENPYRLADDIWGIGFKTADTIAEKMGFDKEKFARLRSGLLYTLNKLSEEGHCYALRDQLVKTGAELLSVEEALLSMTLDEMIRAEDVKVEHTDEGIAIYLPPFYFSEVGTARRIKEIFDAPRTVEVDPNGLEERITRMTGMTYDPVQMDAIKTAVQSKILVLTGGPGTGKTTTTLGIITAFQAAGASILLAAPTGRAAKRLSEATGLEAKTIHRLLEVKPPEGYRHASDEEMNSIMDLVIRTFTGEQDIPADMNYLPREDVNQRTSAPFFHDHPRFDPDCTTVLLLKAEPQYDNNAPARATPELVTLPPVFFVIFAF